MSFTKFETAVCARCSGSGRYSRCELYGDTCFKCGGVGKVHTPRGNAAVIFYNESLLVPVSELKAGDVIADGKRQHKILSIEESEGDVKMYTTGPIFLYCENSSYLKVRDIEEIKALKLLAFEYQEKLTKAGKFKKVVNS